MIEEKIPIKYTENCPNCGEELFYTYKEEDLPKKLICKKCGTPLYPCDWCLFGLRGTLVNGVLQAGECKDCPVDKKRGG